MQPFPVLFAHIGRGIEKKDQRPDSCKKLLFLRIKKQMGGRGWSMLLFNLEI